jgi:hypothetical protein
MNHLHVKNLKHENEVAKKTIDFKINEQEQIICLAKYDVLAVLVNS